MLPVTIGSGSSTSTSFLNSTFGALVSSGGAARDPARLPDLHAAAGHLQRRGRDRAVPDAQPPGVAPRRRSAMRHTLGNGMRQINLLLIPAAAGMLVLATPITRLDLPARRVRRRTRRSLVSTALFWFAFSLPFGGLNLLLTRTFFALKRPWIPTRLAAINMVVDIIVSIALYKPLRDRRPRDRDRGRQHGHDGPPAAAACGSASTAASRARRR